MKEKLKKEVKSIEKVVDRLKWLKGASCIDSGSERNAFADAAGAIVTEDIAELENITASLNHLFGFDDGGAT